MQRHSISCTVMLSSALLNGCAAERPGDEEAARSSAPLLADNGIHVNGIHVNGIHVNGIHVNGLRVNGTMINGVHVSSMALAGTVLTGTVNGAPVSGAGFVGATMTATLQGGSDIQIRIDDVAPSGDPDITLYSVSALAPGETTWEPLCVDEAGNGVQSFPLSGYWDESQGTATGGDHIDDPSEFTFACQGYALSKCAEMGYKPWKATTECLSPGLCHPVPLGYLHAACTRMLRADYCGDGTSTTRNGTLIDVADGLGIQSPEAPQSWLFEAEWGATGANCVKNTRWPTLPADAPDPGEPVVKYMKDHCPDRWAKKASACGTPFSTMYTTFGFTVPLATRTLMNTRIAGGQQ